MSKTRIVADPVQPTITITREFDGPAELLLRVHTDPDLLVQWLGPRRLTMTIHEYDVRHGGAWRYTHRDVDGTEYGFRGVFHGTPSLDGIVQTFEFEGAPGHVSLEKLTFAERDGRTLLTMRSVYQAIDARDAMIASGMEAGVNDSMDRLAELIAELQPAASRL